MIKHSLLPAAVAAFLAPAIAASAVSAQTPEERGLEIALEIDARDQGFRDSRVEMQMLLRNAEGQTSTRSLWLETLETEDPEVGDKSLTFFEEPGDIEGTAFLSFTKILEPDDQWLYLPALKRVKRISSANKSGPFVGSEFAYEDLTSFEVGKYDYRYTGEEPCGDITCYVIERFPKYENSGYTRQIAWVDTQEYRIVKVDFYDRKDSLLKTLESTEWNQYLNQYWRAHTLHMVNHQTGKETILTFQPYEFQQGLSERNFNKSRLARIR
jgi:hypothetical protein